MASESKSISVTAENRKISRRGFLEKSLTGMVLVSATSLATLASMGKAQAGFDEFSSQNKSKVTKGKGRKKGGSAAKPAGGAAQPPGGAAQPAGGFIRPESAGY
jgi:hypothetical protein